MSRFDDTITKLASSPAKLSVFLALPRMLPGIDKTAAPTKTFTGPLKAIGNKMSILEPVLGDATPTGAQKVMQGVAGVSIGGALAYASSKFTDKLHDQFFPNVDLQKAQNAHIGKLTAEHSFKAKMTARLNPRYTTVMAKMKKDEVISKADQAMINSAYETMKRFAPNLAADENATRSFLREHAIYGTGPSYASLKNLAEAEQAIARSGGAL